MSGSLGIRFGVVVLDIHVILDSGGGYLLNWLYCPYMHTYIHTYIYVCVHVYGTRR